MDYTNKPEVNMQPDTPNFTFLAQLYGSVDGSIKPGDDGGGDTVQTSQTVSGNGNRRHLREPLGRSRPVPESVAAAFDDVDRLVDNGLIEAEGSWRKLHESKHGAAHEIDAGEGFTIQIHLLKYVPPEEQ